MEFPSQVLAKRFPGKIWAPVSNLNKLAALLELGRVGISKGSWKGQVVETVGQAVLLNGKGNEASDWVVSRKGERVPLGLSREPFLVVDFGLWDFHTEEEKVLLLKQVEMLVAEFRNYLWDGNLVFSRAPQEIFAFAEKIKFGGTVTKDKLDGILLDPRAEEELEHFEFGRIYVLGGIVDKSNRMRTQSLGYKVRKSIRLNGKVGAVPNRLNRLAKIIGENLKGVDLEEAIRKV